MGFNGLSYVSYQNNIFFLFFGLFVWFFVRQFCRFSRITFLPFRFFFSSRISTKCHKIYFVTQGENFQPQEKMKHNLSNFTDYFNGFAWNETFRISFFLHPMQFHVVCRFYFTLFVCVFDFSCVCTFFFSAFSAEKNYQMKNWALTLLILHTTNFFSLFVFAFCSVLHGKFLRMPLIHTNDFKHFTALSKHLLLVFFYRSTSLGHRIYSHIINTEKIIN